jgi:hypothetical protein
MCRIRVESSNGSYAGRIAPPGIPNTVSTPTASSERIRLAAPVTVLGVGVAGPGCDMDAGLCFLCCASDMAGLVVPLVELTA